MKRKYDEGYALVFVLVVITVLSIIAISLMSGALKNLQAQQESVERMQAKYEAQGEVEKQIADKSVEIGSSNQAEKYTDETAAVAALIQNVSGLSKNSEDSSSCIMRVVSEVESKGMVVRIECEVIFHGVAGAGENGGYIIQVPTKISYTDYKISYTEAAPATTQGGAAE